MSDHVRVPKRKKKVRMKTRIKELRIRSRLTQRELAKLTDRDISTVSRHEAGIREMDERDILDYARVFKCRSYEIFMKPNKPMQFTDDPAVDVVSEDE